MDHGLLYMNCTDAIAEGDGDCIMRCWKFLLLHFYTDRGSSKYALEALYLQLQQQAILCPRQAYRQRWNRSVSNHGGSGRNVPIDLEVEHDNNSTKEGIRKLGPNLTHAAVTRVARMLHVARATVLNVSKECNMMKRSGKHFVKTTRNDLMKIVNLLVQADVFQETPAGITNISDNSHDHPCMVCIWKRCASRLTVTSRSYRLDLKHDERRHHGINHNFISHNRDLWAYAYHHNE